MLQITFLILDTNIRQQSRKTHRHIHNRHKYIQQRGKIENGGASKTFWLDRKGQGIIKPRRGSIQQV